MAYCDLVPLILWARNINQVPRSHEFLEDPYKCFEVGEEVPLTNLSSLDLDNSHPTILRNTSHMKTISAFLFVTVSIMITNIAAQDLSINTPCVHMNI